MKKNKKRELHFGDSIYKYTLIKSCAQHMTFPSIQTDIVQPLVFKKFEGKFV